MKEEITTLVVDWWNNFYPTFRKERRKKQKQLILSYGLMQLVKSIDKFHRK